MSKKSSQQLPIGTTIEVVLTKDMTVEEYYQKMEIYKSKGWKIQGFQKGFRD